MQHNDRAYGRRQSNTNALSCFHLRASSFALLNSKSLVNFAALFVDCDRMWGKLSQTHTRLWDRLRQLLKDYAPGIEGARREIWSNSRAMNDYAHFMRNARSALMKKLVEQVQVAETSVRMQKYFDISMRLLDLTRTLPTLDLFSSIWKAWMSFNLHVWREVDAWKYLSEHPSEISGADMRRVYNIPSQGPPDSKLAFALHWIGMAGTIPGTGSGNQCTEASNMSWETELQVLGGKASQHAALGTMQYLFTLWADELDLQKQTTLRFDDINPFLLHSETLLKIGVSPTYHYWKNRDAETHIIVEDDDVGAIVAVARNANMILEEGVVNDARALLYSGKDALQKRLQQCGVCTTDPTSGEVILATTKFQEHLVDVVFVFVGDRARAWHAWPHVQCTCLLFALHSECPHCLFARPLKLKSREADVNLDDYPTNLNVGDHWRRDKNPTANTAAARASAKKKARQETRSRLLSEFFPITSRMLPDPIQATQTSARTAKVKCIARHALQKSRFGQGPKVCDLCSDEFSSKC
jgi:hypothetical protein